MADYTKFIEDQIKAGATLIIEDPEEYFGHTQASNILLLNHALTDAEFRVYMVIRSFAYGRKIHCWPGQELIGQLVGKSRETVNRIIQKLEKKNLIHSVQRGLQKTNVYIIKKIPMELVEKHQKLLKKTGINKPANPCKSTEVTKMSHQEKPAKPYDSSEVTKMSHQEVTKTSHKEYKENNNVVVVKNNGFEKLDKHSKPKQTSLNFEYRNPTEWNWGKIREQVRTVAGADISTGFAKKIEKKYTQEQLSAALVEMKRQLKNGMKFTKGIGAWLSSALAEGYEPDQVPEAYPQKNENNNNKTRKTQSKSSVSTSFGESVTTTSADEKKKALIKTLYMN